jgi:hypothetical protein
MVALFGRRAFRLAREHEEALYHVAPIENQRGKEGRRKTRIASLLSHCLSEVRISCIDRTSKIEPPRSFQFTKQHPRGRPCTTTPDISTTISQFQRFFGLYRRKAR